MGSDSIEKHCSAFFPQFLLILQEKCMQKMRQHPLLFFSSLKSETKETD